MVWRHANSEVDLSEALLTTRIMRETAAVANALGIALSDSAFTRAALLHRSEAEIPIAATFRSRNDHISGQLRRLRSCKRGDTR